MATTERTYDAFISYARLDHAFAEAVLELLRAFGQRVFLDKDSIAAGERWRDTIRSGIQRSGTLLLLWSRNAQPSQVIREELSLVPATCRVLPVRLDRSELPDGIAEKQGFEGFQVHERILARTIALTRTKLPRRRVVRQILAELQEDGVDLTQEQRDAVRIFVFRWPGGGLLAGALLLLALWKRRLHGFGGPLLRPLVTTFTGLLVGFGIAAVLVPLRAQPEIESCQQALSAELQRSGTCDIHLRATGKQRDKAERQWKQSQAERKQLAEQNQKLSQDNLRLNQELEALKNRPAVRLPKIGQYTDSAAPRVSAFATAPAPVAPAPVH
ncbi:MAG TPA: toll/interleukin-1 receptor domain-containing protein [Polyangiales bacterium]|nr:toll/interleukin-1 receptor domain-containing protein [Polyangiales bacterium]